MSEKSKVTASELVLAAIFFLQQKNGVTANDITKYICEKRGCKTGHVRGAVKRALERATENGIFSKTKGLYRIQNGGKSKISVKIEGRTKKKKGMKKKSPSMNEIKKNLKTIHLENKINHPQEFDDETLTDFPSAKTNEIDDTKESSSSIEFEKKKNRISIGKLKSLRGGNETDDDEDFFEEDEDDDDDVNYFTDEGNQQNNEDSFKEEPQPEKTTKKKAPQKRKAKSRSKSKTKPKKKRKASKPRKRQNKRSKSSRKSKKPREKRKSDDDIDLDQLKGDESDKNDGETNDGDGNKEKKEQDNNECNHEKIDAMEISKDIKDENNEELEENQEYQRESPDKSDCDIDDDLDDHISYVSDDLMSQEESQNDIEYNYLKEKEKNKCHQNFKSEKAKGRNMMSSSPNSNFYSKSNKILKAEYDNYGSFSSPIEELNELKRSNSVFRTVKNNQFLSRNNCNCK